MGEGMYLRKAVSDGHWPPERRKELAVITKMGGWRAHDIHDRALAATRQNSGLDLGVSL